MKKPKHVDDLQKEDESIRSQIKKMGPICKSRNKKFIHVSPDDDFDEQVVGNGSSDETMWLSSGCMSPSLFFQEHSEVDEIPEPPNLFLYQASGAEKTEDFSGDEQLLWRKSGISTNITSKDEIQESKMSIKYASEAENIEDLNGVDGDEPLFWPFDRKIDWRSEETWKQFTMSPRKDIIKLLTTTVPEETSNASIVPEMNKKTLQKQKLGSKGYYYEACKIKKGNTMPSRLRESTRVSAKMVPLNIGNQILAATMESVSSSTSRNLLEDDFTSNEQTSIETAVGLGEFDGHEGIDSEFNQGVFLLD